MDCPIDITFSTQISKASATYSLTSNYVGNAEISNINCEFDFNSLRDRYRIVSNISSDICGGLPEGDLKECLEGTAQFVIVDGLISSIDKSYAVSENVVNISFESITSWLSTKAISTEPFSYVLVSTAFTDIVSIYGGVPSGNFNNLIVADKYISGPVNGNNFLEELRSIAQAGSSHLFTQVDGKLTASPWWACSQQGNYDIEIPCLLVVKATKVVSNNAPPTILRVRGAFTNTWDCGEVSFSDSQTDFDDKIHAGLGAGSKKCVLVGISQKDAEIVNYNLAASKEDLQNANVNVEGLSLRDIVELDSGRMKMRVTDTDQFIEKGQKQFYTSITGTKKREKDDIPEISPTIDSFTNPYKFMGLFRDTLMNRAPMMGGQAFGRGFSGGAGNQHPSLNNREPSSSQLELIVYDVDGINAWGINEEQIENKYVTCKEDLLDIAIMRFQQWRMEQDAWEVEIVPMPCLELNQYVLIELPQTADCGATTVEGIISGIQFDQDVGSATATMKLSILGTGTLCDNEYFCGNLINNFCGTGGSGEWSGSGTNQYSVGNISNDSLVLLTIGSFGYSYVYIDQPCLTIGDQYTITFLAEFLDGTNPTLLFNVDAGGIGGLITSTGYYSYNFTASADTHQMLWSLYTVNVLNFWRVSQITLTKTVTA